MQRIQAIPCVARRLLLLLPLLLFLSPRGLVAGSAAIYDVNLTGVYTGLGPFGPYANWSVTAVSAGQDGLNRILWNNISGEIDYWLVDGSGNVTSYTFGPFSGWTAVDVAAGPDNVGRVLWSASGGSMLVSFITSAGVYTYSPSWGPFSGWTAHSIACGGDGTVWVLWTDAQGDADLWHMDSACDTVLNANSFSPGTYGFAGVPADVAVGSDNQARLLWDRSDGACQIWSVNSALVPFTQAPFSSVYAGWTASRIDCGADGMTRLLWVNSSVQEAQLWLMNMNNTFTGVASLITYSPPQSTNLPVDVGVGVDNGAQLLWSLP